MATLLMAPFTRRGTITTRGGQVSCPPLVRATTSPIPRGHGLIRGITCTFRMHRWGWGTGRSVSGHDVDMVAAVISVLKSGPVRFFCLFWCNWTATSLQNLKKIGNRNCNRAQLVACSCMVGCDWLQSVVHQTSPGPHSTSQNLQVCLQFCTIY